MPEHHVFCGGLAGGRHKGALHIDVNAPSAARSKASGDLLQVRTGKFVRSIKAGIRTGKTSVTGRVYSNDPRAQLFEFGGTTPPHDIAPKNAKALLLQMRGGTVFAASVHHPGGKYEARNIIHSAFDEMKAEIVDSLERA